MKLTKKQKAMIEFIEEQLPIKFVGETKDDATHFIALNYDRAHDEWRHKRLFGNQ